MQIGLYEDWMKPQVAYLFSVQYSVTEEYFQELMTNFYEHPFQINKCIRIVATEGKKVVGFQSFFYWPYQFKNKTYNSYQSGNSLVHNDYRGQGIFQKMLNYLDEMKAEFKIDFLIGFPIKDSYNSMLRNNWLNIFNLQWYIKPMNIFSFFRPLDLNELNSYFPNTNVNLNKNAFENSIKLLNSNDFDNWRVGHYQQANYFSFRYTESENEIVLKLKTNVRKKYVKELIIGDIISNTNDEQFITNAFLKFIKIFKKVKCITFLSIARNVPSNDGLAVVLKKFNFLKIKKQIYFIFKPYEVNEELLNKANWIVFRGDIDTW